MVNCLRSKIRRNQKLQKKGQVAIQMNWLFVLIAGALILIFFIGLVYKQKTVTETKQAANIATKITTILTGAEVSTGTVNVNPIPPIEIKFSCEKGTEPWIGIDWEKTGVQQELSRKIVFAPDLIKGINMISWSQSFTTPFKVGNFLYLTSPEIRYIFVKPLTDFENKIFNDFPEEIIKQKVNEISGIQNMNNYKIKFIYFNEEPRTIPQTLQNTDVSAIKITGNKITFYKKNENNFVIVNDSIYIGKEMLYGAIFAETHEMYECAIVKAFKRLRIIADIYSIREKKIKNYYATNTDDSKYTSCYPLYTERNRVEILKTNAILCEQNIENCPATILEQQIQQLKTDNGILKTIPCPLLY